MGPKKKAQVNATSKTSAKGASTLGQKRKQEDTTDDGFTQSVPAKDAATSTVKELQKELKEQGLKTSGKKAELEERLKDSKSSTDSTNTGGPPSVKKQKTDSGMFLFCSYVNTNLHSCRNLS